MRPEGSARYRALIISRLPQFAGAEFTPLSDGWDSVALECDGWIFKFPKSAEARDRLVREVALLSFLRPRITMPLPQPELFDGDEPFSRHRKIEGEQLLTSQYQQLGEGPRNALAMRMAQLYTELHQLPLPRMRQVGAVAVDPWMSPDEVIERALPRLPRGYKRWARQVVSQYRKLTIAGDELVFGYFDGHGWNMAFDFTTRTLSGVYDFADAGFGSRHRDLSYSNWIAADLTLRIIDRYEELARRKVDRRQVMLYSSVLRLTELAQGLLDEPTAIRNVVDWVEELKQIEHRLDAH